MKRFITLLLTVTFVLSLTGCSNPFSKSTDTAEEEEKTDITAVHTKGSMDGVTLKIGVSPDFAPFTYQDEQGEMKGFDIDYLDIISEYLGFDYVLVVEQMADIETDIEEGKIDCAISGISITDSRQADFLFTDSYFSNSLTIIKNKDVEAESRKDLIHMKLGAEKGTAADEYLEKYLKKYNNTIRTFENSTIMFRALERGRLDAAIYDATGVEYYMDHHPDTNIEILDANLNEDESSYGIMCGKDFKYLDEFNVAMKQLDLSGSYQELYNKWFRAKSEE